MTVRRHLISAFLARVAPMPRSLNPVAIGVLCAIPVALIMAWFANGAFDPESTSPYNFVNRALGMGPLRGVAFAVGALVAAAIVAPRLAREDLGSFGGLFAFVGLAHVIAIAGVELDAAVRDPGSLSLSILVEVPVALAITLGASLILWAPTAGVWVAAVRSLTIDDLPSPTDLERAQSEERRNEAAREHVRVDATTIADQGSRLWRNRG